MRAALGLSKGPIATAGDRIARGWLAGVDTGEHREGSDKSAANQGAMAVLAGLQRRLLSVRHAKYVVSLQLRIRLLLDVAK